MKYLSTFERRYQYLNSEDTGKLEKFLRKFIKDLDIYFKIDLLTLANFIEYSFAYEEIFDYILTYSHIYKYMDEFLSKSDINASTPANRNTAFDIFHKIYEENKRLIKTALDKKLIKLLEENPKKYKQFYHLNKDELNNEVKNACEWMLDLKKYNI